MELNTAERIALSFINSRHQQDTRAILADVERRLGLDPGALGTTHALSQTGEVVEVPRPQDHVRNGVAIHAE